MNHPGFLRACLLCVLASVSTVEAADALRLEDAIIRTLERNPELAVFAYELKAQQGRVQQAGARSPIEAGLLVENALGTGSRSSFDAAETTLSLGFMLEHGALQRRREAAAAGTNFLETELNIRRIDAAAEASRRFITVLESQQHVVELRRARELADQTLEAVRARVRAAKVPQAEEARAQAALARAKLDEEHAEHELLTARRQLTALWGELNPTFTEATGALSSLPALPTFESLRAELDRNPDFERFVSEQRLRETELRLAETKRRAPWQLTTGVRRFEDGDDHAFIVGLTVPLQSRDYARGAVAQAQAQLDEVEAKRSARRVQLDTELFAIYQELYHAYTQVTMLRDDVLPKMEEAVEESRYAYERGRYSYVEWVAAQRELLEMRSALSAAYVGVHRYRVEIERLVGTSLTARTPR
jgi:cobalt-zinc-cadmium efflux system outer membrane protein